MATKDGFGMTMKGQIFEDFANWEPAEDGKGHASLEQAEGGSSHAPWQGVANLVPVVACTNQSNRMEAASKAGRW